MYLKKLWVGHEDLICITYFHTGYGLYFFNDHLMNLKHIALTCVTHTLEYIQPNLQPHNAHYLYCSVITHHYTCHIEPSANNNRLCLQTVLKDAKCVL